MSLIISVCDDDPSQLSSLRVMLTEWNQSAKITEYNSAEQYKLLITYTCQPNQSKKLKPSRN